MMKRWLVALVLVGGVRQAAAQDPRLATRLDPAVRSAVTDLVDSARARHLPSEPLIQKALEGASKGASGPRIVAAVRGLLDNLQTARGALGTESTDQELVAGAAALRAGATTSSLTELRQARGRRPLEVPLAVLADLVARGVTMDAAYRSVLDLARTNAADTDFLRLGRELDGGHRQ